MGEAPVARVVVIADHAMSRVVAVEVTAFVGAFIVVGTV
jgi:hypothetical protein